MIQPNIDLLTTGSSSPTAAVAKTGDRFKRDAVPDAQEKAELLDVVWRTIAGEPAAQADLMQRYSRRVAGFVRAIIRQPDAVEDVTQMVFIKMFRRLGRLRDPIVFESWLFTLARNTSLDFIRRRNCRPNTVALDDEINQIPDPSTSSATSEILAALDRALTRLSPVDRSLVTQFVAGDSYGTIAERTGLSLATVKVRLHRVRPFLRSWVGQMTDTRQTGSKGWRCLSGSPATARWTGSNTHSANSMAA